MSRRHAALIGPFVLIALAPLPRQAAGQTGAVLRPMVGAPAPPAPVAPAVVSRSGEGGLTVRAVRVSEPMKIDGRLTERGIL